MAVRCLRYARGPSLATWILLFADDGKATIPVEILRPAFRTILAVLAVFGFPVK